MYHLQGNILVSLDIISILDPAPTWLVKRLLSLLAETLAKICNASFHEGIFPANLKEAVVRPRL